MTSGRGIRRRSELIDAGVALLAEGGWEAVTQRAVAARASANPGLVHYYFHGTSGLHLAVAERAAYTSIGALAQELVAAEDERELVERMVAALSGLRQEPTAVRLIGALVSAAFAKPEIGALVRRELAGARSQVEQWLSRHHPDWSADRVRGSAAAFVALADGAALHLVLDPGLSDRDLGDALRALPNLAGVEKRR